MKLMINNKNSPSFLSKANISISFDFETSAQTQTSNIKSKMKSKIFSISNYLKFTNKDLSNGLGRGYGNRKGAEIILKLFKQYGINATWFCTGHALLKENIDRNAFRINQTLPYAVKEAGFTSATTWRKEKNSFYHEPFSDFKKYPYYYFGDLVEKMRDEGQDIQCHTFSHPYISMEPLENIIIDLEDWQNTARRENLRPANIFAFPFLGDYHYLNALTNMKVIPAFRKAGLEYKESYLGVNALKVLKEKGIELITRCGSVENYNLFHGFKKYRNSDIYFMKDKPLLSFNDKEEFKILLDEVVSNKGNLDLWLHPNDILEKYNYENFKSHVEQLVNYRDTDKIHLCTISEQWNYYKENNKWII